MLSLKESTRWLTKKGRHDEAWESLKWVRGGDSQETRDEMEEIRLGVEMEARATEGFQFKGELPFFLFYTAAGGRKHTGPFIQWLPWLILAGTSGTSPSSRAWWACTPGDPLPPLPLFHIARTNR